jgi:hypothetical protein
MTGCPAPHTIEVATPFLSERGLCPLSLCYRASMQATISTSARAINEALNGFANVVELSLISRGNLASYDLTVVLANDNGDSLRLRCNDVSNLRVSEFGGGLTQLLALRCDDVRDQQHDRVTFHFSDLERALLDFNCFSAEVLPVQA